MTIPEVILWKHPTAKFAYVGDGSSLDAHVAANGDVCYGLAWDDKVLPRPTMADIAVWLTEAAQAGPILSKRDVLLAKIGTAIADNAVPATVKDVLAALKLDMG